MNGTSNRRVQANCLVRIGGLEGFAGRFDAARQAIARARGVMDDFGLLHLKAHSSDVAVIIEMLAGDHEAAEREARTAYTVLEEMGDRTYQASEANLVAKALVAQDRADEADEWRVLGAELGDPDSVDLDLQAQILACRGLLDDAERCARSALAAGDEPVVPVFADPRFTLAEILARTGRAHEARQEIEACVRRYETKGIVPLLEKARALLATLPG
jgi:ATP/maltotriose-dependent transcriptional regulator MalT